MNKLKNIAMIAFAGLALTACNNNEEPQIDNAKILKIEARICGEETRANTEGNGDKFLPGDIIKIKEVLSPVEYKYIPYITNEGTVNGVATFVPQSDDVTFGINIDGYLDNGDERCTIEEFYLPEDQSTVEKLRKADWIVVDWDNWNSHQVNIKEQTLNLSFEHKLTKVTVVISEYSNNMSNVNVGEVIPTDATMYSFPNDVLNKASNIEISPLITQDKTKGNHKFTAIVSSNCYWIEGDTILKFKFEGIDYIVKAKEDIVRWPGKHLIINIKLNGKQTVSPSKVSVAEWENGGNYSTEVSNPN